VTDYDLDQHELVVLIETVRTLDLLDRLETTIRSEGVLVDSPQGRKANPAAVEARQQRITLARLLAALRMPAGEDGTSSQPPGRVAGPACGAPTGSGPCREAPCPGAFAVLG